MDLADCKNSKVNELSVGQLQRLGIALSVIHNPQVILADEPTSSLDDENCKIVIELLTTDDEGVALERAMQCEQINRKRQDLCAQIEQAAIALIHKMWVRGAM